MTDLLCALVDESVTPLIRPFSVFNSLLEQRLRNTSDNFLSSSKIVDGTACAGGNTISFACRFKNVVAFEIDELRWNDLLFNLNLLKINHYTIIQTFNILTKIYKPMKMILFSTQILYSKPKTKTLITKSPLKKC